MEPPPHPLSSAVAPRVSFPADLSTTATVIDEEGREWIGTPITERATASAAPPNLRTRTTAEIDSLSDDEYLEGMMPIRGSFDEAGHGVEYRLVSLDAKSRARLLAARQKQRDGWSMRAIGLGQTQEFIGTPPQVGAPSQVGVPSQLAPESPRIDPRRDGFTDWTRYNVPLSEEALDVRGRAKDFTWSFLSPALPSEGLAGREIVVQPGCLSNLPAYCDERWWVTPAQVYQWPQITSVMFTNAEAPGSGTNIGRFTTMTCAHLFYTSGGQQNPHWYSTQNWKVGLVRRATAQFTQDQYTVVYPPNSPPNIPTGVTGCYTVTFPNTYLQGLSDGDYAIVEYTCGYQPGSYSGWVWPGYGTPSQYLAASAQMYAYDSDPPEPYQPSGYPRYVTRSLIGRFSQAGGQWVDSTYSFILNHRMDSQNGASGGGMLMPIFGGELLWAGDHVGVGVPYSYNTGRLLTASSWGFIRVYSNEY